MKRMSRERLARGLACVVGRKNTAKLQMWLKYILCFKKEYVKHTNKLKIVVFMIDGKTPHGGLSDRLRGLFSVYYYCMQKNYCFKVAWVFPFKLQALFNACAYELDCK